MPRASKRSTAITETPQDLTKSGGTRLDPINFNVPRMEIVYRPIDWFREYSRNPRKNDAVVDRMCASIREFGFAVPMLCRSNGEVVDGHLRCKSAKKLGMQELPVVLCDHWTEGQVKAFAHR